MRARATKYPKDRKGTETYRAAAEEAYGKTDILTGLSRFGLLKMPHVDGPMRPAYRGRI